MAENTADNVDLTWKLDQLTKEPGITAAVLVTVDGLKLAHSGATVEAVERASAASAGLQSLATSMADFCGRPAEELKLLRITMDLKTATVLLFTAGTNSILAVAVEGDEVSPAATLATSLSLKTIGSMGPALAAAEREIARREQVARSVRSTPVS
ncbi:roadblock/LC7 domain-containing protein [Streptomyces sp. NPDC048638]|uniref:roadblock/LC7 domain-containing protein n=1 Tax=Streptomyces sp. NPDC048638 TaxID=3365580 RepID=UPI0037173173